MINIGRKEAVFFGVVILVFVVAGLGVSIGSGDWQVHGHDSGEIEGVVGGGTSFGNYGSPIIVTSALSNTETNEFIPVQAATDLLLVATARQTSSGWNVVAWKGYTGETSNPTIYRGAMSIARDWGSETMTGVDSFTMFVKEGEYYVVKGRAHIYGYTERTYTVIPLGS